jgi:hypothetical protein
MDTVYWGFRILKHIRDYLVAVYYQQRSDTVLHSNVVMHGHILHGM